MATKDFSRMTSSKLKALMEVSNDEDKMAIQEVLNQREQLNKETTTAPDTTVYEAEDMTEEERRAIEEAEKNGGNNPLYVRGGKEKPSKEELETLAESLKEQFLSHKCEIVKVVSGVPVTTTGYIMSVLVNEKSSKVVYAIKLDNGKRVAKAHNNDSIRILDEVVEPEVREKRAQAPRKERKQYSTEEIEAIKSEAKKQVGKLVEFKLYGKEETLSGRITGFVVDMRGPQFLYKIAYTVTNEAGETVKKFAHKTYDSEDLKIAEEFDADGQIMQANYEARANGMPTACKSIAERIAKVEAKVEKLKAQYELQLAKLEALKAELEPASTDGQNTEAEDLA